MSIKNRMERTICSRAFIDIYKTAMEHIIIAIYLPAGHAFAALFPICLEFDGKKILYFVSLKVELIIEQIADYDRNKWKMI